VIVILKLIYSLQCFIMVPKDWSALQYWGSQKPVCEVCTQKSLFGDRLHITWEETTQQRGSAMETTGTTQHEQLFASIRDWIYKSQDRPRRAIVVVLRWQLYVIAFSYKYEVCIHLMMVWMTWNMCHSDKFCVDWCFVLVKFCMIRMK